MRRLFPRLLKSHLLASLVSLMTVFVVGWLLSERYYALTTATLRSSAHPEDAQVLVGFHDELLRALWLALFSALPLALALAAATSYRESRRLTDDVQRLATASRKLARGDYGVRIALKARGELSELADDFNEMAGMLERAEKERLELITVVAHELRTPLAALQGYAEALADGVIGKEAATAAIRREAAALRRMAHDLLLVARVEAGAIDIKLAAHPPQALLATAYERFSAAFEGEEIALKVVSSAGLPDVWVDAERVGQVLSNLLTNALRYTPEGGAVSLGARATTDSVEFFVSDTGPGIPPEHAAHVFERFYRPDTARSRQQGGIGVGLAITRGLVEAMGGRIWLEETPAGGATFAFTLPAARDAPR
jgi:signal transduction histidine kinase